MIKIEPTWLNDPDFLSWKSKAIAARDVLLKAYRETGQVPNLKQEIWQDYKKLLCRFFHKPKCAYCEARLPVENFPPHAEHYRPKKAVTESRQRIDHTGYFWLAYEWDNLFLACHNCNCWHTEGPCPDSTSNPGKSNEFRIQGVRIQKPSEDPTAWEDELENERPLLLNPNTDAPEDHITFDENGVPVAKNGSEHGKETITVCNLDRMWLCERRRDEAESLFRSRIHRLIEDENASLHEPSDPFSSWLKCAFKQKMADLAGKCGLQCK